MGDVYQATDTKLGRSVAIKFLPEAFSHDTERVARFQREARVLASLNHPNIAAIYGVEQIDSRHFLVMELVSGETLADRIKRGAIPIEEALSIGTQIAEGLEEAHEKGIIHRDLKPANIKVTPEGKVKVLDFGLAKAYEPDQANTTLSNSPTISMAATIAGVILGTAAYMSPEQAKGRAVDKRADIWAFAVVLYELLTGRQLFHGDNLTEVLASVVKDQPDLTRVPFQVRRLLAACLEKDPNKRLRDIGDVWKLLDDPPVAKPETHAQLARSRASGHAWAAVTALVLLALVPANVIHWRESPPALRDVVQFQIAAPEKSRFDNSAPSLSPDGRKVVFAGATEDGICHLWVRSLDTLDSKIIADVQGAPFPFWSPDSRYVGYFDRGKLRKVESSGGMPQDICSVPVLLSEERGVLKV